MAKKVADWQAAETRLNIVKNAHREAVRAANIPNKKNRTRQDELMNIVTNAHEILAFCWRTHESNKRRGLGQSQRQIQIYEEARQYGTSAARLILDRYHPKKERKEMLERWLKTINPEPAATIKDTVKA